ncbi:MAG TPA: universal stress protein [Flavobacteriaceae bacterium]|nr:universal stress protein [Flavobacteriaceae bacterium]
MKTPKTILVALDLSATDKTLITYASFLAETLDIEQVYFVHNIKKYKLSQLFAEQLKDINLDEIISEEINENVEDLFKASVSWEVLISEDPYTETLINYIVDKYDINLVLLGNKNYLKGSSTVSGKLLRMLKCDMLLVPKDPDFSLNNIWIGTDFSRESRKALGKALSISKISGASLTAAHVYNVPLQFSPYLPKGAMAPKIQEHVAEKFDKLINKIGSDIPINQKIIPGRESGIAEQLIHEAQEANADLLLVSDKGSNNFSTLLIGSSTENIFNQITKPALWVVKR